MRSSFLILLVLLWSDASGVVSLVSQDRRVTASVGGTQRQHMASAFGRFEKTASVDSYEVYPGPHSPPWRVLLSRAYTTQNSVLVGDTIHAELSASVLNDFDSYQTDRSAHAINSFAVSFDIHNSVAFTLHYQAMATANGAFNAVASTMIRLSSTDGIVYADTIQCRKEGIPAPCDDTPVVVETSGDLTPGRYALEIHTDGQTSPYHRESARSTCVLNLVLSQPIVGLRPDSWSAVKALFR